MSLAEALFLIFPVDVSTDIWSLSWAALSRWPLTPWLVVGAGCWGPRMSPGGQPWLLHIMTVFKQDTSGGLEMAPLEAKA